MPARVSKSRRELRKTRNLDPELLRAVRAVAEEAAERAAKRATHRSEAQIRKVIIETMSSLGFVVEDGKDQSELVADARFLRKLRVQAESRPGKLLFAAFST